MQKKYPCKGCVEKYTNQFNEVDEPGEICGLCIEIAKRKGLELSPDDRVDLLSRAEYTKVVPKGIRI